eukprot:366332-Chlamydomonas_euryale.AAC.18
MHEHVLSLRPVVQAQTSRMFARGCMHRGMHRCMAALVPAARAVVHITACVAECVAEHAAVRIAALPTPAPATGSTAARRHPSAAAHLLHAHGPSQATGVGMRGDVLLRIRVGMPGQVLACVGFGPR